MLLTSRTKCTTESMHSVLCTLFRVFFWNVWVMVSFPHKVQYTLLHKVHTLVPLFANSSLFMLAQHVNKLKYKRYCKNLLIGKHMILPGIKSFLLESCTCSCCECSESLTEGHLVNLWHKVTRSSGPGF